MTELTVGSTDSMMRRNIEVMTKLESFDVIILCCGTNLMANFWQNRLERGKGSVLAPSSIVLCVEEDWVGGAGNALGTLYAFQKAKNLAFETLGIDIEEQIGKGEISVGLYHTAGKGTRMAPLPGAENNNKPGVKLPATVKIGDKNLSITILESVIKQTGCYAKSRMGRLSVFWGDQVFIPTVPVEYNVTCHIDILCSLGPMMNAEEWAAKGMDKYGLIAQTTNGKAAQVEKVNHATAVALCADLGEIEKVGASLGSFSISNHMLFALLKEFSSELVAKVGKLDSDPHLWMPMTLGKESYQKIMLQKGTSADEANLHYDRIATMMETFNSDEQTRILPGLFGPVDVGQGVCWWDYGQLQLYLKNALLITEDSNDAKLMRLFFGVSEDKKISNSTIEGTDVDKFSCIQNCLIGRKGVIASGFVRNSALSNVKCNYIEAENCVLIDVTADRIIAAPGSIIYNVTQESNQSGIFVNTGEVQAGVFSADGIQTVMHSTIHTDGGIAWKQKLDKNKFSFEHVYEVNTDVCPLKLERIISDCHDDLWRTTSN